jgi:hypothetical protein
MAQIMKIVQHGELALAELPIALPYGRRLFERRRLLWEARDAVAKHAQFSFAHVAAQRFTNQFRAGAVLLAPDAIELVRHVRRK